MPRPGAECTMEAPCDSARPTVASELPPSTTMISAAPASCAERIARTINSDSFKVGIMTEKLKVTGPVNVVDSRMYGRILSTILQPRQRDFTRQVPICFEGLNGGDRGTRAYAKPNNCYHHRKQNRFIFQPQTIFLHSRNRSL